MSKERELLERAMESLDGGFLHRLELKEKIRAYLAVPRPEFVRLSEEEVSEILSSAYTPYEAVCATENRLVEKNK